MGCDPKEKNMGTDQFVENLGGNNEKPTVSNPVEAIVSSANILLKAELIKRMYNDKSWVYIDFIKGDRFIDLIKENVEGVDFSDYDAEDLCEYALDKIAN